MDTEELRTNPPWLIYKQTLNTMWAEKNPDNLTNLKNEKLQILVNTS